MNFNPNANLDPYRRSVTYGKMGGCDITALCDSSWS
jgi:hypothetical protein